MTTRAVILPIGLLTVVIGAFTVRSASDTTAAASAVTPSVSIGQRAANYGQPRWLNTSALQNLAASPRTVEQDDIADVRKRAERFYLAWTQQDAQGMFDLVGKNIRKSVSKDKYIAELKLGFENMKLVSYHVTGMERAHGSVLVTAELSLSVREDEEKWEDVKETDVSRWVSEGGKWFFDGLHSHPSPRKDQ